MGLESHRLNALKCPNWPMAGVRQGKRLKSSVPVSKWMQYSGGGLVQGPRGLRKNEMLQRNEEHKSRPLWHVWLGIFKGNATLAESWHATDRTGAIGGCCGFLVGRRTILQQWVWIRLQGTSRPKMT